MKRSKGSKAGAGARETAPRAPRRTDKGAAETGRTRARAASDAPTDVVASPRLRRLGERLAWAALVVPPFVVVPVALDPFRMPQRLLAEWLALASLAALVWSAEEIRGAAIWRSTAVRATAPLLALAALSLFTSSHHAHVADALADLAIGVATLGGWSLLLPRERLRKLLDAIMVPGAGLAVIAILQLHDLWQPILFGERLRSARYGITSLAGNAGDLAAFLVLPCLVAQAGLPAARGRARWWRLFVLATTVYALAGTQTLTSLAAAAAGSLLLWSARLPPRRLVVLAGAATATVLLLGVLVPPLRERVVRLQTAFTGGDNLNNLLSGRLDGWRVAARLLAEHPVAGVGLGAYRAEFAPMKLRLLAEG